MVYAAPSSIGKVSVAPARATSTGALPMLTVAPGLRCHRYSDLNLRWSSSKPLLKLVLTSEMSASLVFSNGRPSLLTREKET